MLPQLNFPSYELKLGGSALRPEVYDPVRRRFVALTPEEWVRQHTIAYLSEGLGYPQSLIAVEGSLTLNDLKKRFDILLYNTKGQPVLLVECKAPNVKITQAVFDQAARYNMAFKVSLLFITNGLQHYCCRIDHVNGEVSFLDTIPHYTTTFDKTPEL